MGVCVSYRPRLRIVPAVGWGRSKLSLFHSPRWSELLFVHSDVELGSHLHSLSCIYCSPPVCLNVMNILLLPCHLVAPPFAPYLCISYFHLQSRYVFSACIWCWAVHVTYFADIYSITLSAFRVSSIFLVYPPLTINVAVTVDDEIFLV